MAKADVRSEKRIAEGRRGTLTAYAASTPCVIQDMSTKGFLIMSTKPFNVGDVVQLKTELYPGQVLTCDLEVRHVTDEGCCLGTRIVEISPAASNLCRQFIEEHYAERLKFG